MALLPAYTLHFLSGWFLPSPMGFGRNLYEPIRLEFLWIPLILYGASSCFCYPGRSKNKKKHIFLKVVAENEEQLNFSTYQTRNKSR